MLMMALRLSESSDSKPSFANGTGIDAESGSALRCAALYANKLELGNDKSILS